MLCLSPSQDQSTLPPPIGLSLTCVPWPKSLKISCFLDRIKRKVASIVCPLQHEFRAGRLTVSSITISQSKIPEAFAQNNQLDSIHLEFS